MLLLLFLVRFLVFLLLENALPNATVVRRVVLKRDVPVPAHIVEAAGEANSIIMVARRMALAFLFR